jgi:DNA-binding transcriptional LysR family regulator
MDTTRLASLVAAADHGSLSEAARQLRARLSTVSRHISELEAEVGQELLVRTGRGVRPTTAGERFIERARFVLRELHTAVAEARGVRSNAATQLRLSVPTELALSLLPECLVRFHAKHPQITLDVHSAARRVSLLEEDFDAAIRLGSLPNSDVIARPLGSVSMVLCVSPRRALPRLSLKALGEAPFVGVAGTPNRLTARVRGTPQSVPIAPRIQVSTFTEAAEVAAGSELMVVLPAYTARRYVDAKRLVPVRAPLELPTVPVHLLLDRRHRDTTALKELGALITEQLIAVSPK